MMELFDKNQDPGHFELINRKEHTDTYLNCRTLVSDQDLLKAIAQHIWKTHVETHEIDCVLAVGTSAIPLAVNLAYRFECGVTFTLSRVKVETKRIDDPETPKLNEEKRQDYNLIEMVPTYEEGQNLLIIDDVISGGSVAQDILEFLYDDMGKKPGKVYHHSIFRLGNREYIRDDRIVEYDYIEHIPDVMYASENCPLCQKGEQLIREIEMY